MRNTEGRESGRSGPQLCQLESNLVAKFSNLIKLCGNHHDATRSTVALPVLATVILMLMVQLEHIEALEHN